MKEVAHSSCSSDVVTAADLGTQHSATATSLAEHFVAEVCRHMSYWYLDLHCKPLLLGKLDLLPLLVEVLVLSMLAQALQHVGLRDPFVTAQSLSDEASQLRVAPGQPPAGCHTVGLVLELLWCQVIEVLQQCTATMISHVLAQSGVGLHI